MDRAIKKSIFLFAAISPTVAHANAGVPMLALA
jgi:hypothetical protein